MEPATKAVSVKAKILVTIEPTILEIKQESVKLLHWCLPPQNAVNRTYNNPKMPKTKVKYIKVATEVINPV